MPDDFKPEIISIVETWLYDEIDRAVIGFKDYIIFRKDISNGTNQRGEALLSVKSYLNPALVNHTTDSEILAVDIYHNLKKFKIITAYL